MRNNAHGFWRSFVYATRGIRKAFRGKNIRVQLAIGFYVVAAGFVTGISAGQWAVVLICCALVLSLECVNTAIEGVCDLVCPANDERVAFIKDAAAGAVLVACSGAAVAGAIVFLPRYRLALEALWDSPVLLIGLAITLALWAAFIIRADKL